ncbi:MAG: hypothetical protein LUD72_11000 [Bacteroidales bacterium]|nr:hypothetical protein [Bacteroidales bacterium]
MDHIYVENSTVQFDVSSSHIVFTSDEGTKTVLVATNMEWDYECDASWLSVNVGEGLLEVIADANFDSNPRYAEIVLNATNGTDWCSETISVAQRVSEGNSINLSAEECANCYMANTETSYRFRANVKGNGISQNLGGIKEYADIYGTEIDPDDIVYADLLWEAALDGDKSRSFNVIDNEPIYEGGYVWFTTGFGEGNAVIAVKNAKGEVLWSWHIWVTDQEIKETLGNGYYWMDRNLGANSTDELDVNNKGLLYQWGRKDPFLPSYAAYGAEEANVPNTQVGDGSGVWDYTDFTARLITEAPGNVPASVQNPMSIILHFGSSVYGWYMPRDVAANDLAYLWGDSSDLTTYVKSMFDPCPPGYTVPVENAWVSANDQSTNTWNDSAAYGRYWTGGGNSYYPCAGWFNGISDAFANAGNYGYYWTSGKHSTSNYFSYYIYFTPATYWYYSYSYPASAMSVRCMRVN